MRKGKVTEAEEMMITDWISSNLPLCHEGLRRRLQVPLQQIVINIHVKLQNRSHLIRFPVALRHSALLDPA